VLALPAPFAYFSMGIQNPVHRAPMAQIHAFIKQGGVHLTRRTIHKTLTIQHGSHLGSFFSR
jgi:hypothetical protein